MVLAICAVNGKDCRHYFLIIVLMHRLQLALVFASREVVSVHEFFTNLNFIINMVGASCKPHDQLQATQAEQIAHMRGIGELKTGK
jgi:hypothetical protein